MAHSLDVVRGSAGLRDGLEPRTGRPGRFPYFEGAGKLDALDVARRLVLEAPHQKAPGGGSEIVDRLGDGGEIGPQRPHPVEVVEADDRDVAGDFEAKTARGLDRGQRANVGEGENRGRPIGAVELKLDRAAQAFEVVAAVDDAVARLETRFDQGAAGAGDALLHIIETLGMGENRDVP